MPHISIMPVSYLKTNAGPSNSSGVTLLILMGVAVHSVTLTVSTFLVAFEVLKAREFSKINHLPLVIKVAVSTSNFLQYSIHTLSMEIG